MRTNKSLLHPNNKFSKWSNGTNGTNGTNGSNGTNGYKKGYYTNFKELNRNAICKRCGIIFIKEEDENKNILVVKGSYTGIWSFPKGRVIEGESDEECASREVWEETGIVINPEFLKQLTKIQIDNNIYFIYNLDLLGKKIEDFSYLVNDKSEISDIEWKNISELSTISINKDIRIILKQTSIY